MFKKIVLATDFSSAWEDIIACGGEFRALGCSQVILAHVITATHFMGLEEILKVDAQPKLEAQRKRLEELGLRVVTEMPLGLPGYSLNEVARRHRASLIVVGSHGKSLWREAVLGSVSSAVLHHAEFPVLLLKVNLSEKNGRGSCHFRAADLLSHVLFPTDFSEIANRAFLYLRSLVPLGLSEVSLLHTMDNRGILPVECPEEDEKAAKYSLSLLEARLRASGVSQIQSLMYIGHPISAIMDSLREAGHSLILMGTHGKDFFTRVMLGSVAYNIARLATCPVLLIPKENDEY
ncbi:MAG: universal stress protein [Syntrophobacteraceae bacterium]